MIREFEKYKYLGIATARKYYSHYFVKWEEDVIQTAYLGVYRALKDVDLTKIKNEVSLKAYITLKVRGEITKWEKSLFGGAGTKRREAEYSMISLNYSLHDSEADERITILDTLTDTQAEDDMIRDMDLRRCLKTLKEEELMIMNWIASGRKMIDLSRETGINKDKLQRQKKKIINKLKKSLTLSV